MNAMDNERLTAYALGEIDEAERAEIEQLLAESQEARQYVEEVRETAALLTEELQQEPCPALSETQAQAIVDGAARQRPRRWLTVGVALAASLTLVAGVVLFAWHTMSATRHSPLMLADMKTTSGVKQPVAAPAHGGGVEMLPENASESELHQFSYNTGGSASAASGGPVASGTPTDYAATSFAAKFNTSGVGLPEYLPRVQVGDEMIMRDNYDVNGDGAQSVDVWSWGAQEATQLAWVDPEHPAPFRPAQHASDVSGAESYERIAENAFLMAEQHPLSTFSIDVDTASYSNVRRFITGGQLPPPEAVRIEELINYFTYDYAPPTDERPFAVHAEVTACPWKPEDRLVRIGLKGKEMAANERKPCNFVFVLDVSGSMQAPNKLPLLKKAMKLLAEQLGKDDQVSIVTFSEQSRLLLSPTTCDQKQVLGAAIDELQATGNTNGAGGLELAYDIAKEHAIEHGNNRVIIGTDGDFNVGVTANPELVALIQERAKAGTFLTVLGFGEGNLQDAKLEALADKGNGNYAYIDTFNEARRVLCEQLAGTTVTIAKDVKVQVEFNPGKVQAYRLIGYENRVLADRDFNDDRKDAGDVGAGHTVTALYEVVPVGVAGPRPGVDALKFQKPAEPPANLTGGDELLFVKLRYKQPEASESTLFDFPVKDSDVAFEQASPDTQFAAAVAAFGMLLRNSDAKGNATFDSVLEMARAAKGADPQGYRAEFLNLVATAKSLAK